MFTLNKFTKYWRLRPVERGIFLRAVGLLTVVGVGLQLLGFRRVQTLLDNSNVKQCRGLTPCESSKIASSTASVVVLASRHGFYVAKCLPISLVLRRMLQSEGIKTDLRVGVRKVGDELEAHAWVEHNGRPLIDGADVYDRFAAFGQPLQIGDEVSV